MPQRAFKHKRWLYCFVATPEVAAYFAVSDLTYTSNAFAMVVDLRDKKVLVDRGYLGLPGPLVKVSDQPGEGLEVSFLGPGGRLAASRPAGDARYHVAVDLMRLCRTRSASCRGRESCSPWEGRRRSPWWPRWPRTGW